MRDLLEKFDLSIQNCSQATLILKFELFSVSNNVVPRLVKTVFPHFRAANFQRNCGGSMLYSTCNHGISVKLTVLVIIRIVALS